jgi:bifunctional non-homologous end joining protein LigD
VKLPCRKKDEFIIAGWTSGEGSRASFGALVLAQYDDAGTLRYAGTVGSGFGGKTIDDLMKLLKPLVVERAPIEGKVSGSSRWGGPKNPTFTWVRPQVVVEVAYKERTKEGQLRQSSFLGIRRDKPAAAVHPEKVGKAART